MCVTKKASGQACKDATRCMSGSSVDDVCCENACAGSCQACSKAKNDKQDGKCLPVKDGSDPDNECNETDKAQCGHDGFCDGKGACRNYSDNTTCKEGSCSATDEIGPGKCDGKGKCGAGKKTSCNGTLCKNGQCTNSCTPGGGGCSGKRMFCEKNGKKCSNPLGPGKACEGGIANECSKGTCVSAGSKKYCCEAGALPPGAACGTANICANGCKPCPIKKKVQCIPDALVTKGCKPDKTGADCTEIDAGICTVINAVIGPCD